LRRFYGLRPTGHSNSGLHQQQRRKATLADTLMMKNTTPMNAAANDIRAVKMPVNIDLHMLSSDQPKPERYHAWQLGRTR